MQYNTNTTVISVVLNT